MNSSLFLFVNTINILKHIYILEDVLRTDGDNDSDDGGYIVKVNIH